MMNRLLTALSLCLFALPLRAGGIPDDMATVDLLPGWRTASGTHMTALRVRLAPGWKTYWRAPGDAGIPPSFDFAGSRNVQSVSFHWPTPELFLTAGMTTVGYTTELILPIEVRPDDASVDAAIRAEVDMGVCEDICVPVTVTVAADLPAEPVRPDGRIRAALADRPMSAEEAGAGAMHCDLKPAPDGVRLEAVLPLSSMGQGEFAVVELGDADLWISAAQLDRQGRQLRAAVDVAALSGRPVAIDRTQVRLTVLGSRGAVEIQGCD